MIHHLHIALCVHHHSQIFLHHIFDPLYPSRTPLNSFPSGNHRAVFLCLFGRLEAGERGGIGRSGVEGWGENADNCN